MPQPFCELAQEGEEGKESLPTVHCSGRCTLDGELDKLMDIFCATTTAAALLEAKFGLELTGHHKPRSPRITNI
ncbi:MAG: hypothetical protein OJF51_003458 [Nitrospira sp.]|jgi:hypothetical protein|nr:MAG: hypothetical protein OJF51_003458 [Nitrospira sp.]